MTVVRVACPVCGRRPHNRGDAEIRQQVDDLLEAIDNLVWSSARDDERVQKIFRDVVVSEIDNLVFLVGEQEGGRR